MHQAIHFHYQAGSVAIEVYDEAVNDLLTAEVEPLEAVAAQRRPESSLSRRHSTT
jgi:hypothetical protein